MNFFVLFSVGLAASSPLFLDFIKKYNKVYDNNELEHRLRVFLDNLKIIEQLNLKESETVYGIGPFADLSTDEFNKLYTGWVPPQNESAYGERVVYDDDVAADSVDWREKNAVTAVKNQGRCGSCWAFSATEGVESQAFLSGKYPLTEMSAQQITSCDKGSSGCNGGWPGSAFDYLKKAGGLEKDADYPYTAGGGTTGSCKFVAAKAYEKVTGYKTAAKGEDSMLKGLQSNPFSICHQTGGWQHYTGGSIMTSCSSGGGHCTQLIGYSSDKDYWIVKNSWGTSWGSAGYIYIKKGKNLCGVSDSPMFPQIA